MNQLSIVYGNANEPFIAVRSDNNKLNVDMMGLKKLRSPKLNFIQIEGQNIVIDTHFLENLALESVWVGHD
jgi:hypothetical protein